MFKTLRNAWKISEIRSKILFTLLIIALYRIGAVIPAPFVDYQNIAIAEATQKMTTGVFAKEYAIVNVETINSVFEDGAVVNAETLIEKGVVKKLFDGVKVLGRGEITKKVTVQASIFSASAKEKIEAVGGTCEVV